MHIRNFLISLNETETNIFGIMLILTIGTIHELIVYIKKQITKRKEEQKNKNKSVQRLVNALQRIEDKYNKSFIDWHKNNKD